MNGYDAVPQLIDAIDDQSFTRATECCLLLLLWVLLLGLCLFANQLALFRMEFRDSFVLINSRTIHNMALIDFINGRPNLAGGYLLLTLAVLTFCAWRKHPPWSVWVTSAAFAAPCFLYADVCGYISFKIVLW